jgi:hypothetical protein
MCTKVKGEAAGAGVRWGIGNLSQKPELKNLNLRHTPMRCTPMPLWMCLSQACISQGVRLTSVRLISVRLISVHLIWGVHLMLLAVAIGMITARICKTGLVISKKA